MSLGFKRLIATKDWFVSAYWYLQFLFLRWCSLDTRYQLTHPLLCNHSCHRLSL